jgi:hypothetical protein
MRVTGTALAAHLFCTRGTLGDYVAANVIPRPTKTGYDVDECRKLVLRHLRDKAGGRMGSTKDGLNLTAEKARRERSQTDKNEFSLKILRGHYVLIESVGQEVERLFGIVREGLLAIPGKIADAVAQGDAGRRVIVHGLINSELAEVLNALSSPEDVVGQAVGEGVQDPEAASEVEPDRVVRSVPASRGKNKRKPRAVAH